jgi:hypothetical protein
MQIVCENIDQLVTIGMRPTGMPRGVIPRLYKLARDGREPISYIAAQAILNLPRSSHIGILTGAVEPTHLPRGESDGPMGAAAIAYALRRLGFNVSVLLEDEVVPVMEALLERVGGEYTIVPLAKDDRARHAATAPDLDAVITIEKQGGNPAGVMHGISGVSRDGTRANVDGLMKRLNGAGKLTIGIGDGGNEIGFGNVYDAAKEFVPHATTCQCPCGKGILTVVQTKYLYPVAVSNWGAYALAAALGLLTRDQTLAHDAARERDFLHISMSYDCRDGGSGANRFAVDGVPGDSSIAVVQMLSDLVRIGLTEFVRPW